MLQLESSEQLAPAESQVCAEIVGRDLGAAIPVPYLPTITCGGWRTFPGRVCDLFPLVNLVNPSDTPSRQHSTESPCRTVSSRLPVMALWPTCPARGPPDTAERSSRKLKQRTNALVPPPPPLLSIRHQRIPPMIQLRFDRCISLRNITDNDYSLAASPRTTPRSLST